MAYLLDRLEVNTGQYTHYLDVYFQSNSSATNQTYLRVIQWVRRTTSPTYGAYGGSPGFSWSNNCGGSSASGNSGAFDFTSVQDITVSDRYFYITHNADGTKSITISLYKGPWTSGFPEASGSKSVVLPTIPLSTQPVLSASTVEIGDSVTVDLSGRASSGFTHKIEYDFGGLLAQTAGLSAHEDVETSATFTPPIDLLTQMVGLSSKSATIRVTTWNGATQVGAAKTAVLTLTPPAASPYTLPFVGATVARSLSDGTPDPEGTCLTVTVNAGVSSIDTGTEQNDLTYLIEARPYGSGSFLTLDTDTVGGLALADSMTFEEWDVGEPFALDTTYDVRVTITDELGSTAVALRTLTPVSAFLDVYKPNRGVAAGALYSPGVGGDLQAGGQRVALGPYEREVVTGSIAVNATWEGTVAIGRQAFTVIRVDTSSPARVRLHASAAHRTADLARASTVPPSGFDHGVLLDVETDADPLEVNPTMVGGSLEDPPSSSFPITVERLSGSTGALTVTLTVI